MEPICTACGRQLPAAATFCTGCGTVVEGRQSSTADITGTIHSLGTHSADPGPLPDVASIPNVSDGEHALVIVRGPSAGSQIELVGDQMTAGRAPDNAIFLDDITVSRQHASFSQDDGAWQISDLDSLNGTYVNGSRIDRVELVDGDDIQIGKYRFRYVSGARGVSRS